MEKRFNLRVYGLWIDDDKILINEEIIRGKPYIKFPGGGLDYGEGIIDGLKREFIEELNIPVEILSHYYTTDFFQLSAYDNSQVISIYYRVSATVPDVFVNHVPNERTFWFPIAAITPDTFTLPIDKKVGIMLKEQFG